MWSSVAFCFGNTSAPYESDTYHLKYFGFPSYSVGYPSYVTRGDYGYADHDLKEPGYGKSYATFVKDYVTGYDKGYKPDYFDDHLGLHKTRYAHDFGKRFKVGSRYAYPSYPTPGYGYGSYGGPYGGYVYRPYGYHKGYSHSYGHGHSSSYHHHHGHSYKSPIYLKSYGPKHYGHSYSYGYE